MSLCMLLAACWFSVWSLEIGRRHESGGQENERTRWVRRGRKAWPSKSEDEPGSGSFYLISGIVLLRRTTRLESRETRPRGIGSSSPRSTESTGSFGLQHAGASLSY